MTLEERVLQLEDTVKKTNERNLELLEENRQLRHNLSISQARLEKHDLWLSRIASTLKINLS